MREGGRVGCTIEVVLCVIVVLRRDKPWCYLKRKDKNEGRKEWKEGVLMKE